MPGVVARLGMFLSGRRLGAIDRDGDLKFKLDEALFHFPRVAAIDGAHLRRGCYGHRCDLSSPPGSANRSRGGPAA